MIRSSVLKVTGIGRIPQGVKLSNKPINGISTKLIPKLSTRRSIKSDDFDNVFIGRSFGYKAFIKANPGRKNMSSSPRNRRMEEKGHESILVINIEVTAAIVKNKVVQNQSNLSRNLAGFPIC